MVELQPEDDAALADPDKEIIVGDHQGGKAATEELRDRPNVRDHFCALKYLDDLVTNHATQLGAAGGRDVRGAVVLEPAPEFLRHHASRNGIDSAPEPFAGNEHVRLQPIGLPAPH